MIALYKRLSLADGDVGAKGKPESDSIEHQADFLASYVSSRHEFEGVETVDYVDDGYTGINFERPAFKKMMEGVRNGEIDTIIVKDISRFGRDYIGVGEYLEQLFPLLGVRFIAVNNNYDSINYKGTGLTLDLAVNNLVNTMYSRDIGRKLHFSNEVRWKKGYSTGSAAPFGYVFDPGRKGRFKIDGGAAKIVRFIFELAMKGLGTAAIAYELNEKKMPIPSEYNRMHKITGKEKQYTLTPDKIWNSQKVWRVLRTYEYTGAMVLGKSRVLMPGTDVIRSIPEDFRYVTENAHEAIVTHAEWLKAQEVIRKKQKNACAKKRDFPLKKKIRCGHCRRAMHYNMSLAVPKAWCREGADMPKHSKCPKAQYSIAEIEAYAFRMLRRLLKLLTRLNQMIGEYDAKEAAAEGAVGRGGSEKARDERLSLYREYAEGKISLKTYRMRKRMPEISEPARGKAVVIPSGVRRMAREAVKHASDARLTKEAADAFIENVYLGGGKDIEIRFYNEESLMECMEAFGICYSL